VKEEDVMDTYLYEYWTPPTLDVVLYLTTLLNSRNSRICGSWGWNLLNSLLPPRRRRRRRWRRRHIWIISFTLGNNNLEHNVSVSVLSESILGDDDSQDNNNLMNFLLLSFTTINLGWRFWTLKTTGLHY
jgi:hypothetical protein